MLKTEDVKVFWYRDLQDLITNLYDQDINILDLLFEPNNDTYQTYEIDPVEDYRLLDNVGDDEIVQQWIDTGNIYGLVYHFEGEEEEGQLEVKHILHRLYKEGHIEAGKYLMTVWW